MRFREFYAELLLINLKLLLIKLKLLLVNLQLLLISIPQAPPPVSAYSLAQMRRRQTKKMDIFHPTQGVFAKFEVFFEVVGLKLLLIGLKLLLIDLKLLLIDLKLLLINLKLLLIKSEIATN